MRRRTGGLGCCWLAVLAIGGAGIALLGLALAVALGPYICAVAALVFAGLALAGAVIGALGSNK